MTIHHEHPFRDPSPDQARRLRGRLGGAVALVTTQDAGLTVSSLLVSPGDPPRLLALLDPDADLTSSLLSGGRGVVQLLRWRHRDLAEAFAGQLPAPGGPFRMAQWVETPSGRRLADTHTWAELEVEDSRDVGWSVLVTARLGVVEVGTGDEEDDEDALEHRRGRYRRAGRAH